MKLIKFFRQSPDITLALAIGALALFLSFFPQLTIARWVFGFTFVFLGSGYPITRILPRSASIIERTVASAAASLLLTYPASVLTVLIEGQSGEAIFGYHLTTSLSSLLLISFLVTVWVTRQKTDKPRLRKFPKLLLIPLVIYTALTLSNLNRADVFADEYDLGYQAYDLVDGIKAGRKAWIVSFSGHPPLAMNIKHFSMNILEPAGLEHLEDWQFRTSEALVGLLTILVVFALAKELYSEKTALIAALILSVNNYMVWMGRIFHREMYMTFFMTVAVYFVFRFMKSNDKRHLTVAGIGLGASLLTKETAVILVAAFLIWGLLSKKYSRALPRILLIAFLMFLPVILFNSTAFIITGYADVFFSNLFGFQRPGATPLELQPIRNATSELSMLWDVYSPLVGLAFFASFLVSMLRKKTYQERLLLIWTAISLLFFSLTAIRAYYFLFLTIPFVVFVSREASKLPRGIRVVSVSILLLYSSLYSYNTNLSRNYSRADDIGRIDGPILLRHPLNTHFSIAARSWVEEVGYKRLQSSLDKKIKENDCLIVSESMNPLAIRRYLGLKDAVKEHYLGQNYLSRYPRCPRDTRQVLGEIYLISNKRSESGELEATVTDHLGNERFYLFRLEKGSYA